MHPEGRTFLRRIAVTIIPLAVVLITAQPGIGIVPPKNGGRLPESILQLKILRKDAFTVKHGWVHRGRGSRETGQPALTSRTFTRGGGKPTDNVLSGRLVLPAVLCLYSNTPKAPFNAGALRLSLFDGGIGRRSVGEYYREVSRGMFDVDAVVYDWVRLEYPESYYVGWWQGTNPETDRTGEMIGEILDELDPGIDFGAYDNDGLDGIPNSGDDDGFVDVLLVIHPTRGAECGYSSHMWSHSFQYSGWPSSGGEPYRTNDAAAGGGSIRIEDYIVAPALSCSRDLDIVNEIGVYCHEIGHAIGLPDLYDTYGSVGIGNWGLMGHGVWNTPDSPAHICGWSKEQLGWVDAITIDWREEQVRLGPVQESGTVVKLPLPSTRFRRRASSPVSGEYALICGYDEVDSEFRNWPERGYGNCWRESMIRRFRVSGGGPVTLTYDACIDAEEGYDFGYVLLEAGTAVETLAVYSGRSMMDGETLVLSDYLPYTPCEFEIRFLFVSDDTESNEDGIYDSEFGYGFAIDNISVQGGGIEYLNDFEEDAGGWRSDSPPAEYFLVENRRPQGFDIHLPGEGLLIWHAENSIAYGLFGNSGGYTDHQARGLVLEEADGFFNLLAGDNKGDTGDPFPSPLGNDSFGRNTHPDSRSNGGWESPVEITGIGGGVTVSALYWGGMPAPSVDSVEPDTIDRSVDTGAILDIRGASLLYGSSCYLSRGELVVSPDTVDWRGEMRLVAVFPVYELLVGAWDLTVVSGDGQTVTTDSAVTVYSIYTTARVTNGRDNITLEWELEDAMIAREVSLYRSAHGGPFDLLADKIVPTHYGYYQYKDYTVMPDLDYAYRVVTILSGGAEERLDLPGPYVIPDLPFIADQNVPNPFNGETTIGFFVPRRMSVAVDVYDVAGRLVHSWGKRSYDRGTQRLDWTPEKGKIDSGVYFCVFRSGRMDRVVKMVLIR
jgi:M6 family metalloprotease-like protein